MIAESTIQRAVHQPNFRILIISIGLCGVLCWKLWYRPHVEQLCSHHTPGGKVGNAIKQQERRAQKVPIDWDSQIKISNTLLPRKLYLVNLFQCFQNCKASSTKSSEFYATFIFKLLCVSRSTLGPIYFIGKIKTQQYLGDVIQRSFF